MRNEAYTSSTVLINHENNLSSNIWYSRYTLIYYAKRNDPNTKEKNTATPNT